MSVPARESPGHREDHHREQADPSDSTRKASGPRMSPHNGSRAQHMHKLILLRHGESDWNRENRFTGWTDVDLSTTGLEEARRAGRILLDTGFTFDVAFTSL